MTPQELAEKLNGREYTAEMTREEEAAAKAAGLVVVFGGSDDLMEFRGAISEEAGAPGEVWVDEMGLLPPRGDVNNDYELKKYFARQERASKIKAAWCAPNQPDWTYVTTIPHVTFEIGDTFKGKTHPYCRGLVFRLADCNVAPGGGHGAST